MDLIENLELGYCSLIKATNQVLDKLKVENTIATEITYKERKETPLWNSVALREAVINAIVHNDWTTEVPPVFEIYSDRIEITSTGGLSSIKNTEDFMRLVFYKTIDEPTQKENKGVTEGVTASEQALLKLITDNPGYRAPFYATELDTSVKNVERWVAALRKKAAY